MLRVGLTGGYATGKSFVAHELERLGCYVIYADKLGHQVLESGGAAYQPTVQLFGPAILNEDESINRKKLGALVFQSPELLAQLTAIVHPAVYALEADLLAGCESDIAVIEAAILIETGRHKAFERVLLTTCEEETQVSRGMARDGITREQVMQRLQRQLSAAEKIKLADYVIDTGGTKDSTVRQVEKVYRELNQLT